MCTKLNLAKIAREKALVPFHGTTEEKNTNLKPIVDLFPKWNLKGAEKSWCAAFVYYCCIEAGFLFPYSPDECISCSLAGCGGWEEFALGDERITYSRNMHKIQAGDIVLYDYVCSDKEHDHIGIVVDVFDDYISCAEGNIADTNCSGIVKRLKDEHIRAYIRIPDGYSYR